MNITPVSGNQTPNFQSRMLKLSPEKFIDPHNVKEVALREGKTIMDILENYTADVPHLSTCQVREFPEGTWPTGRMVTKQCTEYVKEAKQRVVSWIIGRPIDEVAEIVSIARGTNGGNIDIMAKISDITK